MLRLLIEFVVSESRASERVSGSERERGRARERFLERASASLRSVPVRRSSSEYGVCFGARYRTAAVHRRLSQQLNRSGSPWLRSSRHATRGTRKEEGGEKPSRAPRRRCHGGRGTLVIVSARGAQPLVTEDGHEDRLRHYRPYHCDAEEAPREGECSTMTSRSYTKSYSRKVSSVTPGSIQFDKLFRENSNRPSAAKSAGTVGKWGITSFTSIRSTNINGTRFVVFTCLHVLNIAAAIAGATPLRQRLWESRSCLPLSRRKLLVVA